MELDVIGEELRLTSENARGGDSPCLFTPLDVPPHPPVFSNVKTLA
jgi:hypothetical protein